MTITNGYCTLAELQARLGRTQSAGDVFATTLELAIESASRYIDEKTNRIFYSKTITSEYIDQYGLSDNGFWMSPYLDKIYCPSPLISVASIVDDGTTLTVNDDYYLDKKIGAISTDSGFSSDRRGIILSCVIGESAVPQDIKQACITIAEVFSGMGKTTIQDFTGGLQEIQKTQIPKSIDKILEFKKWFML